MSSSLKTDLKRPLEQLKQRSLLLTGPRVCMQQATRGHTGRFKAKCRHREKQDLGTCLYQGLWECCGGLGLRLDQSIQTKKSGVWVYFTGVLFKGLTGEVLEGGGECLSQECLGELVFSCNSAGCLSSRASVNSRPLQSTWPLKMDAKVAILWNKLAKLSIVHLVIMPRQ